MIAVEKLFDDWKNILRLDVDVDCNESQLQRESRTVTTHEEFAVAIKSTRSAGCIYFRTELFFSSKVQKLKVITTRTVAQLKALTLSNISSARTRLIYYYLGWLVGTIQNIVPMLLLAGTLVYLISHISSTG